MTIETINAIGNAESLIRSDVNLATTPTGFNEIFNEGLGNVNSSLNAAESALVDMALDKPVSAHEVMLTMEKAKMELRLVVEVRNKLLEGYQELMRMQV
jgi:flagellar hook-basal body complex protein FliE